MQSLFGRHFAITRNLTSRIDFPDSKHFDRPICHSSRSYIHFTSHYATDCRFSFTVPPDFLCGGVTIEHVTCPPVRIDSMATPSLPPPPAECCIYCWLQIISAPCHLLPRALPTVHVADVSNRMRLPSPHSLMTISMNRPLSTYTRNQVIQILTAWLGRYSEIKRLCWLSVVCNVHNDRPVAPPPRPPLAAAIQYWAFPSRIDRSISI